jgi:hypothetical protein
MAVPKGNFTKNKRCKNGHLRNRETCYSDGHCKICKLKNQSKQWRNNPKYKQRKRDWDLKKAYGISSQKYNDMYLLQKGKCFICSKDSKLVVDHDHTTGKVRHLLCYSCNSMLGLAHDSVEILQRAIAYVRN